MAIKPIRETYKGRKLLVRKNPRQWASLISFVNGQPSGSVIGTTQEAAEREMAQLKRNVDFADRYRAAGEADRFSAYWYVGAPEPTAEEIAEAKAWVEQERLDREAIAAP